MLSIANVADTGNVLIDALVWGQKWTSTAPTLKIKVGILPTAGVVPTLGEVQAIQSVLAEFERVLNIDFEFVGTDTTGAADFTFKFYNDTNDVRYGWSEPVGQATEVGFGNVNILRNNYADPGKPIAPGSSDYITFVHEFAHVLGLAHPHDNGGGSGVFPGVTSPGGMGYHDLNQGVYTTMSYLDGFAQAETWGWGISFESVNFQTGEVSTGQAEFYGRTSSTAFGLQSGLMGLDIAALQVLYGANTQFAGGDDTYSLPTFNGSGTAYVCLWDTAGNDSIVMRDVSACTIDLRDATLQVEEGGGGFISSAANISGGFTIAADVAIENAIGNAGNDILIGNALANRLDGQAGDDLLTGYGGKDTLWGGAGADSFIFKSESDSGPTMLSADTITDFQAGTDIIDLRGIDANNLLSGNQAFAFKGFVGSFTDAAQIRAAYVSGNTVLYLNTDADMSTESVILLNGIHLLSAGDFLL
jgi:serralysin